MSNLTHIRPNIMRTSNGEILHGIKPIIEEINRQRVRV